MTNRQLVERIIGDLNELIDVRGNKQLIPQLVVMRGVLDEITELEAMVTTMTSTSIEDGP
jgi:hypothetical protein